MKVKISIEDARVKTKIKNFIKTCESLLSAQKDLDSTQQAINTFKVLLRFLKNDNALIDVYEKLNSSTTILKAYKAIKEIADNDFTVVLGGDSDSGKYQIGDVVQLGKKLVRDEEQALNWIVVAVEDEKALLFAEKSCVWQPFDYKGGNKWSNSSLRKHLNGVWLKSSFSAEERAEIVLPKKKNAEDDFSAGPIFIFTIEQMDMLVQDTALRCDKKNVYWTASAGEDDGTVVCMARNGTKQTEGVPSFKTKGARPAFWVNNVPKQTKEEEVEETAVNQPKRIIIVDDASGYYVAYAGVMEKVTSGYLRSVSAESTHYPTLEAAQEAIDILKKVNSDNWDFIVENVSMTELLNKEFDAANQKHVITDQDGFAILHIYSSGKKVLPYRDSDAECRLINKYEYKKLIKEQIAIQNESLAEEFDHYTIGKMMGYEVACDCDAPHIRYEVFKARCILESFDEFTDVKDTFVDDGKYYTGYIDALLHALELQHECIFKECQWAIELVDLRKDKFFTPIFDGEGEVPEYGKYSLRIHNTIPELALDENTCRIVLVPMDSENEFYCGKVMEGLNLSEDIPVVFIDEKGSVNKTQLYRWIRKAMEEQCTLGNGNAEYRIPVELVDMLINFKEFFKEDYEGDGNYLVEQSAGAEEQERAIDLRYSENVELSEYKYKDNRILKSIKLPIKMKELPEGIFYNCTVLDYVALPNNLKVIGVSAFEGCLKLWKLYLPETVTRIEDRAFFGCSDLKGIFLPPKLKYIGSDAFSGCRKIKRLFIPPGIQYIAEDAFDDCTSLTKIEAPAGFKLPYSIEKQARINYYKTDEDSPKINPVIQEFLKQRENKEYTTEELLNDTGLLLKIYSESDFGGLPSVMGLLSEESNND